MQDANGIPGAFQNGRKFPKGRTGRRCQAQLMSQISRGFSTGTHTNTKQQMLKGIYSKCSQLFFFLQQLRWLTAARALDRKIRGKTEQAWGRHLAKTPYWW